MAGSLNKSRQNRPDTTLHIPGKAPALPGFRDFPAPVLPICFADLFHQPVSLDHQPANQQFLTPAHGLDFHAE
jgi:hypothetical protein